MQRKHLGIAALIAVPLLIGGGAAAFAAGNSASGSSPVAAFVADLASHLGISTSTLQGALQATELDQVQKMVQSGKLTQAQATRIDAQIKAGKGMRLGFGFGGGMHGPRMMMGGRGTMEAAASYLGLTPQALRSDLAGGKSLSDIASSTQGKSIAGLEAAITSAIQSDLQKAVQSGRMTQQQEQNMLQNLQQFVQQFVTRTGGHDGGMGWGPPPQGQPAPAPGTATN